MYLRNVTFHHPLLNDDNAVTFARSVERSCKDICRRFWEIYLWEESDGGRKPRLRARYRPAEEKGLWGVSDTTRQLRPTPLALSSAPLLSPAWIRFSKQWCWGHLDLWVIEGEWAACQARRLKIHRTLSPRSKWGENYVPSMSKPKNNHQRRDLLESTRTSFPSLAMTTAKTKSKRVDIFGHRRQSFTRTLNNTARRHNKKAQGSERCHVARGKVIDSSCNNFRWLFYMQTISCEFMAVLPDSFHSF